MMLFISPDINVTDMAAKLMQENSITKNDVYYTVKNYDHTSTVDHNHYRRTKKFSGYSIRVTVYWKEAYKNWLVVYCAKRKEK